jgi:transcriptional regulator with XRE-family HTH domain
MNTYEVFILALLPVLRLIVLRVKYGGMESFSLYHTDYEYIRKCLRKLRKDASLTQTELAERIGVTQTYVSKLELGENYVDVLLFARWCSACNVKAGRTLAAVLREEKDESPPTHKTKMVRAGFVLKKRKKALPTSTE